ncbi:MAG: lipopolysaccharide biosynthesis protein [Caldicoprobacterales bacterium]|jgi:O-antigen/teichoic acid export membrane protein
MSREKKLILNTIILGLGTVLPRIGTFLILPILTSALTKTEYGTYDLILTGLSFILPLISLQIEQAAFRFLLDAKNSSERKRVITNSVIYTFFASVVLCFLGLIILWNYDIQIKLLIILYATLDLFYRYILQVCRGTGQLKQYSQLTIINSVVSIILTVILIGRIRMGLSGLLLSLNISVLSATFYGLKVTRISSMISLKEYNFDSVKKLLRYSVPLLPNSISWWIVGASDRWIIASVLGIESNAIYAVSNKIPNLFNFIYNNFNLAWQESAAKSREDSDINEYYSTIFNALYDFLIGMILILITVSPAIFKIFIDESYKAAYYQMPILFIGILFHCFGSFYGGVYIAFKKSNKVGFSAFLGAIINILINILLISKIGLYAASISTMVSYMVIALYRAADIKRYVSINYNSKKIVFTLALVTGVSIISYLNNFYLNIVNFIFALMFAVIMNRKIIIGIIVQFFKGQVKKDYNA